MSSIGGRYIGIPCGGEPLPPRHMIVLTVKGNPIPKARARTVRRKNGTVGTYTPIETEMWENYVRACAIQHRPQTLLDGPLEMDVTFYLARPKYRAKKFTMPDRKPDLDNCAKSVLDALNGVIYKDDSRIVKMTLSKQYGDPPRVEVKIWEV